MRRLLLLAVMIGCATPAPIQMPMLCPAALRPEELPQFVAHVLADACTSEVTDEVLVEHAQLLLEGCHLSASACLRKVCVRLSDIDSHGKQGLAEWTRTQP